MDDLQRAQDNERLRRLAAEELSSMRTELTKALRDKVELHQDLSSLAQRLSQQEDQTIAAKAEADKVRASLAEAQEELSASRKELAAAQAALGPARSPHPGAASKRKWTRLIPRRVKQSVKKALGRGTE